MKNATWVCNTTAAPLSLLLEIVSLSTRPPKTSEACCKDSSKALYWEIILDKAPQKSRAKKD